MKGPSKKSDLAIETALTVNAIDRLIAGRVYDLELLKAIDVGMKAGASQDDIHKHLLVLARSSRAAFAALQSSRNALIALHENAASGSLVPVVDKTTGLPNRDSFDVRIEEAFSASSKTSDMVLMLIEIGALQFVAKQMGGKVANRLLKRFAAILGRSVKHTDFIARVDSDLFAIVFEHILPENAAKIGRRIHDVMQQRLIPGDDPVMHMLSVTIGITGNKPEDRSGADVLQRARDSLLIARKQVGASIYIA